MSIFISATRKSSGKTTVAAGLCAALSARGIKVRPFKKGPDYIDPMWLARAADSACINLDFHTMTDHEIRSAFARYSEGGVAVVEGNKGLYDGVDAGGGDSNAALAKLLGAAVILVVDASGMTRGVAPLLLGYRAFDSAVKIAGVIFNRVGGARHESKLRAAVENYTDFAILGAMQADDKLVIPERHLGLVTDRETAADDVIKTIADAVAEQVDVDAVIAIAERGASVSSLPEPLPSSSPPDPLSPSVSQPSPSPSLPSSSSLLPSSARLPSSQNAPSADLTIAIARDAAFGFYYADDLVAFAEHGAKLVAFDALRDATLPDADGLYIGGGFPETHAAALSANTGMRESVRDFVAGGRPTYAECGGLMYLAQSVSWRGETHAMCGAIDAQVAMHERAVGRGYVVLSETENSLWSVVGDGGDDDGGDTGDRGSGADGNGDGNDGNGNTGNTAGNADSVAGDGNGNTGDIPAHEFHYSRITGAALRDAKFAYEVKRGYGIDGRFDGLVCGNTLANYSHFRHTAANPWVARFVGFVRECKAAAR